MVLDYLIIHFPNSWSLDLHGVKGDHLYLPSIQVTTFEPLICVISCKHFKRWHTNDYLLSGDAGFCFPNLVQGLFVQKQAGYLVQELLHKSMCGWLMHYLVSIPAGCCSRATTGSDWPGERTCHEWKLGPTGGGTEENRWREGRWGEGTCVGRRGRREVERVEGERRKEKGKNRKLWLSVVMKQSETSVAIKWVLRELQ